MKHDEIYILTDGCMWEKNKEEGTFFPHAIEVVDSKTGQVRYIKSGSRIAFLEGEITITRSQETYNKVPKEKEVPDTIKDKLRRTKSKADRSNDNKARKTLKN